ncbi:thiamine-phosphate kinase [Bacillus luteolus]|uniref:Thiamine-monophosphate kinase n=1 Tax=Litchfieldia luteola TaxID=682179 RepID=A0ABR9QE74_9BACI|nr:thiamine-phosphate kinase [Cytobacillus luteolus]MBE4906539.1 thiamine-phosphate kinase [Cytobacillus luteolus]MBP1944585.1 thiamine-monophosphate kinase [Cytobacillus luteolus]
MTIYDEFAFIDKIKPNKIHNQQLIAGIGDDAALVGLPQDRDQIICLDTMVEDVHFTTKTMSPNQIGHKALAVNISDIAAMGGIPAYYLVSIAIPKTWSQVDVEAIYEGMHKLSEAYQVDLIGGDTVFSPGPLMVSVTLIGYIEKGKKLLRSNARPGDVVFITGTVGDSAAGLDLLLKHGSNYSYNNSETYLTERHQLPSPRVEIGCHLAILDRVSLNDISDGVASEANEIAKASNVDIHLDEQKLPLSNQLLHYSQERAMEYALFGGEDFELIGTTSATDWEVFQQQMVEQNILVTKVGSVVEGKGEVYLSTKGTLTLLEKRGYNHFK